MKTEYLIHEYTWSNHCISGNKLGWGITASSIPEEKEYMRELEKLAQAAVIDKTGQVEVEELAYSSVCGFVKMVSVPCESGEDKRQNKRVRIYQPKASDHNPAVYLTPGREWSEEKSIGFLPPVSIEKPEYNIAQIIEEMHLQDRLPEFIQVVFWCLSGHSEGINIVASEWEEKEFAEKTKKLMYVIHSLLPQSIREKAGYVSFTREAIPSVSYYFSKEACGTYVFDLSKGNILGEEWTNLDSYFYEGFASICEKKDLLYENFEKEAEKYLKTVRNTSNTLKKIEWIFYDVSRKQGKSALDMRYISENIPELLYWVSKDRFLNLVVEDILKEVREYPFSSKERQKYIESLLGGITGRSKERILGEVNQILEELFQKDQVQFARLLTVIREKNRDIYTNLLCAFYPDNESFHYGKSLFNLNAKDMETLNKYVLDFNEAKVPGEFKDYILRTGIGLLNEEIFDKKRYKLFDQIAIHLNRKEQWIKILEDFVKQLCQHAELFDKKQMETACYIEGILCNYCPETKRVLREEHRGRNHRARKESSSGDSAEEDSDMGRRYKGKQEEIVHLEAEEVKEASETGESAVPFLLTGFPQGFLTGCIMYLSHYSLMIGHWKIALGMAGMWILLMLNYGCVLVQRRESNPLWKVVGLCLIEGWLIEAAAWFFHSQKIRLYYFIVLGIVTVMIQVINLIRMKREKENNMRL